MSSLSLAHRQCLVDQRRPRCIVVRRPECVQEILNQDCGIHLFQTRTKSWLDCDQQELPKLSLPLLLFQTTSENRERKLLESVEWGFEAIMSKRNACQFFSSKGRGAQQILAFPPGRRGLVPLSIRVSHPLSFHRTSSDSFIQVQTAVKPSYGFWQLWTS